MLTEQIFLDILLARDETETDAAISDHVENKRKKTQRRARLSGATAELKYFKWRF